MEILRGRPHKLIMHRLPELTGPVVDAGFVVVIEGGSVVVETGFVVVVGSDVEDIKAVVVVSLAEHDVKYVPVA